MSRLRCPAALEDLHRLLLVEEALSPIRHDVGNKLAAARNGLFYVGKRVESQAAELLERDPRVKKFLGLIEEQLDAVAELTRARPPAEGPPGSTATLDALLRDLEWPLGVEAKRTGDDVALAAPAEALAMATFLLLENAVDAGARAIEVKVEGEGVQVVDDGHGFQLPAAEALKAGATSRPGRLGLGLNIAKRLAGRWGGGLTVTSSDRGASVQLEVRRTDAQVPAAAVTPSAPVSTARRVLLVDDSESLRLTLGALLEEAGYSVKEAATLAEAEAALDGGVFELAVLDVNLPDGKGTSLMGRLRALQPGPRVVVMSGAAAEPVEGASVVEKSMDPVMLLRHFAQRLSESK